MPTCKGADCEAEIIYVPSRKSGRTMVLDAKPRKAVILAPRGYGAWNQPETDVAKADALVVNVYTDHHATCPDADSFRRKGGAEEDSHR
jgi:hypothetical protein